MPQPLYAIYVRLSKEEKRNAVDPDTLQRIHKEMQQFIHDATEKKILYMGPIAQKIKDTSVVEQLKVCIKWCEEQKVTVEGVYIDYDISGAAHERKQFDKIEEKAKLGYLKGVITKQQDRLARDVIFQETRIAKFISYGCPIKFVYGQEIADNAMVRKIIGSTNEYPVLKGKEDYAKMLKTAIETGRAITAPPWGYRWTRSKDAWELDPKEAPRVLQLILSFASGKTYKETCDAIGVTPFVYYKVLHNLRSYAGYVRFKKKVKDPVTSRVIGRSWVEWKGAHKPLLTEEQVAMLEKKNAQHQKKRKS